jgi:hypothetical protein
MAILGETTRNRKGYEVVPSRCSSNDAGARLRSSPDRRESSRERKHCRGSPIGLSSLSTREEGPPYWPTASATGLRKAVEGTVPNGVPGEVTELYFELRSRPAPRPHRPSQNPLLWADIVQHRLPRRTDDDKPSIRLCTFGPTTTDPGRDQSRECRTPVRST